MTAENVRRNHIFQFGDTGRILHRSSKIPESLDWIMMVIEDDTDVRGLADNIDRILPDKKIDSVVNHITTLTASAGGPQAGAAVALAKFMIRGITALLKDNGDDQLGLIEQSFIRGLHYPSGKRTGVGVQDLTANMWYDYTIFGTGE